MGKSLTVQKLHNNFIRSVRNFHHLDGHSLVYENALMKKSAAIQLILATHCNVSQLRPLSLRRRLCLPEPFL